MILCKHLWVNIFFLTESVVRILMALAMEEGVTPKAKTMAKSTKMRRDLLAMPVQLDPLGSDTLLELQPRPLSLPSPRRRPLTMWDRRDHRPILGRLHHLLEC